MPLFFSQDCNQLPDISLERPKPSTKPSLTSSSSASGATYAKFLSPSAAYTMSLLSKKHSASDKGMHFQPKDSDNVTESKLVAAMRSNEGRRSVNLKEVSDRCGSRSITWTEGMGL